MKKRKEKQRIRWDGYSGPVVVCAAGFSVNPRDGQVRNLCNPSTALLERPYSRKVRTNVAQMMWAGSARPSYRRATKPAGVFDGLDERAHDGVR